MGWLQRTIAFLMTASDPLFAQLRFEQVEVQTQARLDLGNGQEFLVDPVSVSVTGSVGVDSVIAGDFSDFETQVAAIAEQRLEQTMRQYFAMVQEITRRTGNLVDAQGDAAEGLLVALEAMEMEFNDDGTPALQLVVSPDVAGNLAEVTRPRQRAPDVRTDQK
jgi:hypothetical protein